MKKEKLQATPILVLAPLVVILTASAAGDLAGATFSVKCGTGRSLTQVLRQAPAGSSIKFTGTCRERITITKDGITLDGEGTAVIEGEGVGPFPSEFEPVVMIDGAHGVTLKDLTIQNGTGEGVLAKNGASVRLKNVTARNNGNTGIVLFGNATAELEGVKSQSNLFGLDVFDSSTAILQGTVTLSDNVVHGLSSAGNSAVDLRAAQLTATNNGGFGLIIAGTELAVYGFAVSQGSAITASDNGQCGIAIVSGGRLVVVSPPPFFGSGVNVVTVKNNRTCGITMPNNGAIESPFGAGRFVVEDNPVGLNFASNSGGLILGGLEVHDNEIGVLADAAGSITFGSFAGNASSITGNTLIDVDLRFGSRVTFCDDITVGSDTEDGSVLTRVISPCPAP